MLVRVFSLPIQVGLAWLGGVILSQTIPATGEYGLMLHAFLLGLLIWVTGALCQEVIMSDDRFATGRLLTTVSFALIAAAALNWLPAISPIAAEQISQYPALLFPIAASVVGYQLAIGPKPA